MTSSKTTAVQVVSKTRGVRTIVEHVGFAHGEEQLAVLIAIARERIRELAGQVPLDVDGLGAAPPVTAAPTVAGSRMLWEVLEAAYARLGFDTVGSDTFRKLVLARVVEPTPKADTLRVWDERGVPEAPSLSTVWRTLARCVKDDWRAQFAAAAYSHATRDVALTVVLYDVTTLYFEAEYEDDLRKVGMSKERRVDPQILIGLLVDQGGFPLEVHEFEGNKGEMLTLLPVLDAFRDRHQATDIVVVADAGMLSAANLDAGFSFIVGSRTSSAPYDLAEHYATVGTIVVDGESIDTTRKTGKGAPGAREAGGPALLPQAETARQHHVEQADRMRRADRCRHETAKKDRFVILGETPTVNQARIDKAREYIGLKGHVTNLDTAKVAAAEIVAAYHYLFQVEASFRMAKTDLRARPMFASTAGSISAHLTTVFAALAISRHLYATSGVTIRRIVRALRPLRDVMISIGGHQFTATTPLEGEAADILAALQPAPGH